MELVVLQSEILNETPETGIDPKKEIALMLLCLSNYYNIMYYLLLILFKNIKF